MLLLGETGTGKEMLAHAIHAASNRARHPFIALNVAAIPDNLLEAEFFGAAPGAYTGADRKGRDGKFKIADGGTLFLDEIGDMPLAVQAKLLRVLQDQEIEPLGSNTCSRSTCASSRRRAIDLRQLRPAMAASAQTCTTASTCCPSWCHRCASASPTSRCCATASSSRSRQRTGRAAPRDHPRRDRGAWRRTIGPATCANCTTCSSAATMLTDNFRLSSADFAAILPSRQARAGDDSGATKRYADTLAEFERKTLRKALRDCGGKVAVTAKMLGMSRAGLYRKLALLGISSYD